MQQIDPMQQTQPIYMYCGGKPLNRVKNWLRQDIDPTQQMRPIYTNNSGDPVISAERWPT